MGLLIPENFPMSSLANDEERMVVEALRDRLTDGWLIIPNVGLSGDRDRQMDIVIAHERDGIAVIEVKGHCPVIRAGIWENHGRPMTPQPFAQATGNAYALRSLVRGLQEGLDHTRVEYAVAFPNTMAVLGSLPKEINESQVLTSAALDAPQEAIDRLMTYRWGNRPLGAEGLAAIVRLLRPDADFSWDPEARARLARTRLEQICGQHVRVLERLDVNRRVVVTGSAGTGKTRLAMAWTRRALMRGDRVLLTCYNDPLGGEMRRRLPTDERLVVGSFFDIAMNLDGMPELEIPADAGSDFWDLVAVGHLQRHWHRVTARFDTIVVDEGQDLSPAWLALLERLFDPAGPRRMLMVADGAQTLYERGFSLPKTDDGWTRCELVSNCRNTFQIASLIHRCLGGAPAPVGGPDANGVRWLQADDIDQVSEHVGDEIDRIVDLEGHDPARVLFATFTRAQRDRLRETFGFVAWEGGANTTIICETVHRVKGLEFDYVVLVASPTDNVTDALLYVGASRAISGLTIIGPKPVGDRLGVSAT